MEHYIYIYVFERWTNRDGWFTPVVPSAIGREIKPSTVSTAQLRTSQSLHSRPINLVVFQGSLVID